MLHHTLFDPATTLKEQNQRSEKSLKAIEGLEFSVLDSNQTHCVFINMYDINNN